MEGEVVSFGGDSGLFFIDESFVIGHLLILEEDLDAVPELMDLHLFSNEAFGEAVAIGIDVDIALHVHPSVEGLIDRRDVGRKGLEVGFFHDIGRLRTHPQRAF
jgi:hypothetical protein